MAPFHDLLDPTDITRAVFAPATFDATIVNSYVNQFRLGEWYQHHRWDRTWDAHNCFDRLTLWFPPPEVARQLLIFLLETWAEKPATTSALVFIPRTIPSFWWGLSRFLTKLPTIYPHVTRLRFPPLVSIPICVLYLPPFRRSLPGPRRVEFPSLSAKLLWHRQQAALLRGLPSASLS
jgi:hypothetical protein